MARQSRRPHSSLAADLFARPQAYAFFQALRLVERIAATEADATGTLPPEPLGRGSDPARAPARLQAAVQLGFAAAEVSSLRRPPGGGPMELVQSVIGLIGPAGVMPHAFSELVQIGVRERNPGLRQFLDLFNDRLAGLLYEAWAKYRVGVERERAASLGTAAPIDAALRALVGLGSPALQGRMDTPDATPVHFGGLLGNEGRSAPAVARILSAALGHAVRVEQFVGSWLPVAEADRTRLPARGLALGAFCRLGEDAMVGARVFDLQGTVRLHVGPLPYAAFRALLPDGAEARRLSDLAALALGAEMSFRMHLTVRPAEVPALRLGGDPDSPTASRLGWNTWAASQAPRQRPGTVDIRPFPHLR